VGSFSCGGSLGSREGEVTGFSKEKVLKEFSNWGIFLWFGNKVQKDKSLGFTV
jgi:hypothetical protein